MCKKCGDVLAEEESKSDIENRYRAIITPAESELVDLKFKLTREQRAIIKEHEGKTWSKDYRDFFLKCIELIRCKPELIEEMRKIGLPSILRHGQETKP